MCGAYGWTRLVAVSTANRAPGSAGLPPDLVDQLHHRRDGRVELEAPIDVVGDLRDRLVRLAHERRIGLRRARRSLELADDTPQAMEKARRALDARVLPLDVVLGGAYEEDVEPQRVGAVAIQVLVGLHRVALRLGHLGAEAVDHPLRVQAQERLSEADDAEVVHHLDEEAGVHEVEDRVLDPADVLVHGHPVVDQLATHRRRVARASV